MRQKAYRLLLVQRLGEWGALMLTVILVVGVIDYLVQIQAPALRVMVYGSVLGTTGATLLHWVIWPSLRQRSPELHVAQLIERRFPQLQGRLSSALAFLGDCAPQSATGSPALQQSVIVETGRIMGTMNVLDSLEGRRARQAAVLLATACAVTLLVSALNPPAAALVARRLILPLGDQAWPRWNRLEFQDVPRLLARGSDFEAELVCRNQHLPRTAVLEVRFAGSDDVTKHMLRRNDGRIIARLENVGQGFSYRAVAGDDDSMEWQEVEVREPVRIIKLEITVQPPDYTGLPTYTSNRLVRAWAGSQIRCVAELSAPAESVDLETQFVAPPALRLGAQGRRFEIPGDGAEPWRPFASGQLGFRLRDRHGLEVTSDVNCDLTILDDLPPTISIESPAPNETFVQGAEIPVRATLHDDLGITSVSLMHQDASWPLPLSVPQQPLTWPPPPEGVRTVVQSTWTTTDLEFQPGDVIEFSLTAEDGKPQTGQSEVRQLRIISAEEFDEELDRGQAELRSKIEQAVAAQYRLQTQSETLLDQTDWTINVPSADSLETSQWGQRQLRDLLTAPDGAIALAARLRQRLVVNRVDRPGARGRLTAAVAELTELGGETLPRIERSLGNAMRIVKNGASGIPDGDRAETKSALQAAHDGQQAAAVGLEKVLARFVKWTNVRRLASNVADLQSQQQQLIFETEGLNSVGKPRDELTADEVSRLKRLAERQAQLARQTDHMLLELNALQQDTSSERPAERARLDRAIHAAEQTDVAGAAHAAQRSLQANRLGNAAAEQRRVQTGLETILDAISQRGATSNQTLAELVDGWRRRQQSLIAATKQLGSGDGLLPDPRESAEGSGVAGSLAADQRTLAADVGRAARNVDGPIVRVTLRDVSDWMAKAADRLMAPGANPLSAQLAAQAQLERLAAALRSSAAGRAPATEAPNMAPADGPSSPGDDAARGIGRLDLQLLRLAQLEIHRQTAAFQASRTAGAELTDEQQATLAEIERRQALLADQVLTLLNEPPSSAPEDAPPAAPGLDDALRDANIPGFSEEQQP